MTTADRPSVRFAARWMARIHSVQGYLGLGFQAMTGIGIASGALKYYGYGWATPYFLATVILGVLTFAYAYSEGGVWNQVSRDRNDMSNNFATPRDIIDDTLIGVGVYAAVHEEQPSDDDVQRILNAVSGQWEPFRDGIDLENGEAVREVTQDD